MPTSNNDSINDSDDVDDRVVGCPSTKTPTFDAHDRKSTAKKSVTPLITKKSATPKRGKTKKPQDQHQ